ncbi:hypothetical protein EKD04_009490 [Chloroflexales bacterium ZM16-3]|nr:hypothetical protein [Chloroflexales bacterium ZM16-3]
MSELRDEPWIDHRAEQQVAAIGWDVRVGPEPQPRDANDRIKDLSNACVALYGTDMRDPAVQISLAALAHNLMFQRIYSYAQRAALTIELASVEADIEKGF